MSDIDFLILLTFGLHCVAAYYRDKKHQETLDRIDKLESSLKEVISDIGS